MCAFSLRFQRASLGPTDQPVFRDFSWSIEPLQSWLITGPNGGGKSAIAQALVGRLGLTQGSAAAVTPGSGEHATRQAQQGAPLLPAPETVSLISFERQREIIFDERYHDDGDFTEGGVDPGTSAHAFITQKRRGEPADSDPAQLAELAHRLGISSLLTRGVKYLSTGEIRKVLLCRELLRQPALLIFDEPYEGLDTDTRAILSEELDRLISASLSPSANDAGTRVLVISDRYDHVPAGVTHVLYADARGVRFAGPRAEFEASPLRASLNQPTQGERAVFSQALVGVLAESARPWETTPAGNDEALVRLVNVRVRYGEHTVLDGLNLTIRRGEHTLICGPNGCGKSTLLNLINGDNPQVYANDVTICGMKRGSGESVWDIKKQLGQVSYALHVEYAYRCDSNLLETVLSGFYDSIGLYRQPTHAEIRVAQQWLKLVGLLEKSSQPFLQLSYGEQRIALVLRAVVKQPPLLVLDEPCHGLDARHRAEVLTVADYIGRNTLSTLLYVTHDPEERLPCTKQVFEYSPGTGFRFR